MIYSEFLEKKTQFGKGNGFAPSFIPDYLFDFQKYLLDFSLRRGCSAIFADCGLGKTPMELVWAENIVKKTNGRVLILTPLAVSFQTISEGEKFNIECRRSRKGELHNGINVTNYESLHLFNPHDFAGVVCDESSILKSFNGKYRGEITEFMKKLKFRLLATATAAPNDYVELGTSSEALGELGHVDMLNRFFKNDQNNSKQGRHYGKQMQWRFKGHAEESFWKWVSSWARAIRRPSDLGFDDSKFILPALIENEHIVETKNLRDGMLFSLPAVGLSEQREERRVSINERCEKVLELSSSVSGQSLIWCHLNPEGDLLEKIIPGSVQVSGKDSDESKESKLTDFAKGNILKLIIKPKIGAWGLNFQGCSHMTTFPSHSYEQYYQGVRRCWRFGQKNPVTVDIVATEGDQNVLKNIQRKAHQADTMFSSLVKHMDQSITIERTQHNFSKQEEIPSWL